MKKTIFKFLISKDGFFDRARLARLNQLSLCFVLFALIKRKFKKQPEIKVAGGVAVWQKISEIKK